MTTSETLKTSRRASVIPAVLVFILVGLNLRPGFSSVSPLLPGIRQELGLSPVMVSLLTMLPTFCLGLFGPLAPRLAARLGNRRAIFSLLIVLSAALVLRIVPSSLALFLGTAALGAAIGMIGVLMPAIVKADFNRQAGLMMGVYTMTLSLGAATATGASVPIAAFFADMAAPGHQVTDWSLTLAFWALPAVLATICWRLQMKRHETLPPSRRGRLFSLLRNPLAWQVTGFMAAQSSLAFITFGWLPVILQDRGMSAAEAGIVASISILTQTVTALSVPTLAARCRDQRLWAVGIMLVVAAGLAASILGPLQYSIGSGVLLGLGQGGSFGLALTLIVLRAPDPQSAASLSGMVQSIGSVIASFGPFLAGMIRRADGDWSGAVLPFLAIAALAAILGAFAGRPAHVSAG